MSNKINKYHVALIFLGIFLCLSMVNNFLNQKYLEGVKFGVSSCRGGIQNIVPPTKVGE